MRAKRSEQGMILIVAIGMLGILSLIAAGAVLSCAMAKRGLAKQRLRARAEAIAEAGIETGLFELARNPAYRGERDVQVTGGSVDIAVRPARERGGMIVEARGRALSSGLPLAQISVKIIACRGSDGRYVIRGWRRAAVRETSGG